MRKKVAASLSLVIAISLFAVAAWIQYLSITSMAGISVQDMDYQILYRGWLDCLGE